MLFLLLKIVGVLVLILLGLAGGLFLYILYSDYLLHRACRCPKCLNNKLKIAGGMTGTMRTDNGGTRHIWAYYQYCPRCGTFSYAAYDSLPASICREKEIPEEVRLRAMDNTPLTSGKNRKLIVVKRKR